MKKKAKKEVCDEFCQRKKTAFDEQNAKRKQGYGEISKRPKVDSMSNPRVTGFFQ